MKGPFPSSAMKAGGLYGMTQESNFSFEHRVHVFITCSVSCHTD